MSRTPPAPPPAVVDALTTVLEYLYLDEQAHYFGSAPEDRDGHIFESLLVILCWLGGETTRES